MRKTHLVALCIFTVLGLAGVVSVLLAAGPTDRKNQVNPNDAIDKAASSARAASSSTAALDLAPGSGAGCGSWHLNPIRELASQKGSL